MQERDGELTGVGRHHRTRSVTSQLARTETLRRENGESAGGQPPTGTSMPNTQFQGPLSALTEETEAGLALRRAPGGRATPDESGRQVSPR